MDNPEKIKNSELISNIIDSEKRSGLDRFRNSDFENNIYAIINKEKRNTKIFFRKILLPASLTIAIVIFSLLLINKIGNTSKMGNPIYFALASISADSEKIDYDTVEQENIKTEFENALSQILYSLDRESITFNELTKNVLRTIDSITEEKAGQSTSFENIVSRDLNTIKKDILNMNIKKDYSELFSRIIKNITEV
ncbi:MAG: hypothetical protein KAS97_06415 [Candidatus Aminicenantes bacterium]|nr:hypothetical protein [Candidatus Aminicenantes bacterium]